VLQVSNLPWNGRAATGGICAAEGKIQSDLDDDSWHRSSPDGRTNLLDLVQTMREDQGPLAGDAGVPDPSSFHQDASECSDEDDKTRAKASEHQEGGRADEASNSAYEQSAGTVPSGAEIGGACESFAPGTIT
jgi:hypothetical protein